MQLRKRGARAPLGWLITSLIQMDQLHNRLCNWAKSARAPLGWLITSLIQMYRLNNRLCNCAKVRAIDVTQRNP